MRSTTRADYDERILRAQNYLSEHLDEEPRLDDLAAVACFSPFHFHRVFRGMTGETVGAYSRRLRLQRAATQLRQGDQPVTRIAMHAGYDSAEGFSRAFREQFGCAPSEWRESATPRATPAQQLEVRITHRPAMYVACIRHVGPYDEIGPVFSRLMSWAAPRGLLSGAFYMVGMPYDDPDVTHPSQIRCDASLVVSRPVNGVGDIRTIVLPERDYAVVRHLGPYENLGETYAYLCGVWLPASGREAVATPPMEFYRNHPTNTEPDELITDIHLALED
jgi:AraC family transcriptional regulator